MERINQNKISGEGSNEIKHNEPLSWVKGFEAPFQIAVKSGRVALATEKGLRVTNQDALVFDKERDAFAVIDGIGGYEKGDVAARIVAEEIINDFKEPEANPRKLQSQAYSRMQQAGIYRGGAAYLAGRLERNGKRLSLYQAGDCQLIIIDKNGKIKFSSQPANLDVSPRGLGPGQPTVIKGIDLKNYDLIVAATDGLWDNAEAEEVARMAVNKKVEDALRELNELARKGMTRGWGKNNENGGNPDNITIFVYQILPEPLRGE